MEIECYAQRLLNPFRGTVHVVRYRSAEAVTSDGVEWDIYVANETLLDGLGRAGKRAQISDIRYGHWSAEKGLKRGPLYPSDDFRLLEEMGAVVYEHLQRVHRDVPFGFRDRFELWLLDRAQRPLALLHSVRNASETDTRPPLDWRAGILAAEQFRSDAGGSPEDAAARLTRCVNALAGGVAQWFQRSDDGAGLGLHCLGGGAGLAGRLVDAEAFPPLFVATVGMDESTARLLRDYLAWQSPWLLLLGHLDQETRAGLESAAFDHAEVLEKHCRLYPEVIDAAGLKAARVAAALSRSQPKAQAVDPALASFYIELGNPTGVT